MQFFLTRLFGFRFSRIVMGTVIKTGTFFPEILPRFGLLRSPEPNLCPHDIPLIGQEFIHFTDIELILFHYPVGRGLIYPSLLHVIGHDQIPRKQRSVVLLHIFKIDIFPVLNILYLPVGKPYPVNDRITLYLLL